MKDSYLKRYYEEADDTGGGGRGIAAFAEDDKPAEGVVEDPTTTVQPPATTVDAKALAESFGNVLAERFKPEPVKDKGLEELSPEEAKKLLNVWEPTKEWLARYDNIETRDAAIAEQRDGLIRQSDTIAQYRLREATAKLEKEYGPLREYVAQSRERETNERFNKRYAVFSDPALGDLRTTVASGLQKQNKTYQTEDALFDDIAKGMEAVIKVNNPDFKLPSAGSSPAEKPKGQSNNGIPVTTPGAGGGTAAKGTATPTKRGLAIFD